MPCQAEVSPVNSTKISPKRQDPQPRSLKTDESYRSPFDGAHGDRESRYAELIEVKGGPAFLAEFYGCFLSAGSS